MDSTEILKTVTGVLDTLSKKFGVAVDKIYPILLQQTKVDLVRDALMIIFSFIVLFFAIKLIKYGIKKNKEQDYTDYDDVMGCWIVGGLISAIAVFIIFVNVSPIIQIALNPDYYIFTHYIQPLISNNN